MIKSDLLSCDNFEDAVRSLSQIYSVDESVILHVTKDNWPEFAKDYTLDTFDSEYLPWLFGAHIGAEPDFNFERACYYHRALYDGSNEWFKEGLLPAHLGTEAFLRKTAHIYPDFEKVLGLSLANVKDRSSMEGEKQGGPYAFDVLDDAKKACRSGLDYSAPEFFCGRYWSNWSEDGRHAATDLIEKVKNHLKPVIVKFYSNTDSKDQYINNLWHYLFRAGEEDPDDSSHYPCTFHGGGKVVSQERIVSLIQI